MGYREIPCLCLPKMSGPRKLMTANPESHAAFIRPHDRALPCQVFHGSGSSLRTGLPLWLGSKFLEQETLYGRFRLVFSGLILLNSK